MTGLAAGPARPQEWRERSGVRFPILDGDLERPAPDAASRKWHVGSASRWPGARRSLGGWRCRAVLGVCARASPGPPFALHYNAFALLDGSSEFVAVVSGPRRPVHLTKRAAAVTIWSNNASRMLNQHPPTAARKL